MQLSDEQSAALEKILSWKSSEPFFLGGYAGTGKTTLLESLLAELGTARLVFLAPTGKACQVMKSKMPEAEVMTIHSALYAAREISDEELEEYRKEGEKGDEESWDLYQKYTRKNALRVEFHFCPSSKLVDRLVVVDEASMVGSREFQNLLTATKGLSKGIVFVGDPAQLPPVESASILPAKFDAFLKTVHRAALESPITRLAMAIRGGRFETWTPWGREGIHILRSFDQEIVETTDQVLSPMRATKEAVNRIVRGRNAEVLPMVGDKIIVRQNVKRYDRSYLVNGDIGYVVARDRGYITAKFAYPVQPTRRFFMNDEEIASTYKVDPEYPRSPSTVRMDYAYGITVHSSQGSEWSSVLFCDDRMWLSRPEQRAHLLYTAVTRAKEELYIYETKRR